MYYSGFISILLNVKNLILTAMKLANYEDTDQSIAQCLEEVQEVFERNSPCLEIIVLVHSYMGTRKRVISKYCIPRSDATSCGV